MKTKILLFCAVILAVALIGLARPEIQAAEQGQEQSQAEEKKAQEKKQQEQAQTQEEEKQKELKKQPVVLTIKEGEKGKQEITIREGDTVKTIIVDKPIVIKEGAEGKVILITPDGKELKFLGEAPHLEIKADKLEFIKEGKILKVGKDGGAVYVIAKPAVSASEAVTAVEVREAVAAVDVTEAVKVALEEIPVSLKVGNLATPQITWVAEDHETEIREKLREIREKLKKVKEEKLDLKEVEEALAELEKELEKMSQEISTLGVKLKGEPVVYTIVKKRGDEEAAAESKLDIGVDIAEHAHKDSIKVVVKDKGSFQLYYQMSAAGKSGEAYERIVARVKKDLPAGFTLEPEFEEESGLVTLKISGPIDKGAPMDLVNKISDSIRDETKEKKE